MSQVVIGDILPYTQATAILNQTVFGTNWTADTESDVVVYVTPTGDEPDDATQILSFPSQYSVTFVGALEQVQVTLVTPSAAGDIVTITRQTPAERLNLYTNTNFVPSMLNNDFGILTLVDQQAQLVDQKIGPRYNYSAIIVDVVDTILPLLGANQTWVKNSSNTAIITFDLPSGGIAPADASYVTINDETADLPNSSRLLGTANQIVLTTGSNLATLTIATNPVMPGTGAMGVPSGTTAQRVVTSQTPFRYNSTFDSLEFFSNGTWSLINDDTDGNILPGLINNLAYYAAAGTTLSPIATANNGVLVTSAGGVPSISTTLPSGLTIPGYLPLAGGTMAGNISMGSGFRVTNALDPQNPQDYATKFYVDQNALTGTSVYAATINTSMNATQAGAGVGATLTDASGTFAPLSLDGVAIPLNVDFLVKNTGTGVTAANEGIYKLTRNGDGISIPWQGTRSVNYDTPEQINNTGLIIVQNGSTLAGTAWYNTNTIVTVDTTAFNFAQFGLNLPITVPQGGTGNTTFTAYSVITAGTTATGPFQNVSGVGTAGQVLTSNGAAALPTWQTGSGLFSIVIQPFSANGTYTPTTGMKFCIIEGVGAGGGSGGAAFTAAQCGTSGGAGGGGYFLKVFSAANIGANAAVVIGAKGTAGAAGNNNGTAGTATTFTPSGTGGVLTGNGGGLSVGAASTATILYTNGGNGGSATGGDINITGSDGRVGITVSSVAGIPGDGGCPARFGVPGNTINGTGFNANGYGVGGPGATTAITGANRQGNDGINGFLVVTEFCSA